MKKLLPVLFTSFLLLNCSDDDDVTKQKEAQCSTLATVRDYRGLDGCDFVLELSDGTILEPLKMMVCGPPPQNAMTLQDPLEGLKIDGTEVLVDYEETSGGSICMVGPLVNINCITKISPPVLFSTGN